MFFISVITM